MIRIEMTDLVFVREIPAVGGLIGVATLNSPKTLNALNLNMVEALQSALDVWRSREDINAVVIHGAGDRGLCAGGDIKELRRLALEGDQGREFFEKEYRLDYSIHEYPKPLLVWGSGIVMGGGLGLLGGAPYRVVTPSTRIALPEVSIGLYPDVGGSHFLSKAPGKLGLFMGLTGCSINAADAVGVGLADAIIDDDKFEATLEALSSSDLSREASVVVGEVLEQQQASSASIEPRMLAHREAIDALCDGASLAQVSSALDTYASDDKFMTSALAKYASGCPMTKCLVWEQIHRASSLSVAQVFQMEWIMSVNCLSRPDFAEGVRALVIDKDGAPNWSHDNISQISAAEVEQMFALDEPNPLLNLAHV